MKNFFDISNLLAFRDFDLMYSNHSAKSRALTLSLFKHNTPISKFDSSIIATRLPPFWSKFYYFIIIIIIIAIATAVTIIVDRKNRKILIARYYLH